MCFLLLIDSEPETFLVQISNVVWNNAKLNTESYKELLRKSNVDGSILIQVEKGQVQLETELVSFSDFPLVRVSFPVD
jgi:hypothetical protein